MGTIAKDMHKRLQMDRVLLALPNKKQASGKNRSQGNLPKVRMYQAPKNSSFLVVFHRRRISMTSIFNKLMKFYKEVYQENYPPTHGFETQGKI